MDYVQLTPDQRDLADAIHREAIVIDGHSDVLKAVADGKMRLGDRVEVPAEDGWEPPVGMPVDALAELYGFSPHTSYFETMGFYDVPRFLEGGLTSEGMAIYLSTHELDRALHRALEMVYWLHEDAAANESFEVVTTVEEIRAVKAAGKTSGFLTFEGFEPLGYDLKLLDVFARLGLRMASLTHSRRNAFGDGGNQLGDPPTGGLTDLGRAAVTRMNQLGIVIDLGHMNLRGSWEIVERSGAPVVLSHARSSTLRRVQAWHEQDLKSNRHLWEAIAQSGGLVGAIAYSQQTLEEFVDNIDEMVAAIGIDHVALGTDFFGYLHSPAGFRGMHELPNVTAELVRRGYGREAILAILGGNWLRVFEAVWGK
jgi:membrane dipeptidase